MISSEEAAEVLTCACWLGQVGVARRLLDRGADPAAGMGTGLKGQRAAVELLIAGAEVNAVEYPTGHGEVDTLLANYRQPVATPRGQ